MRPLSAGVPSAFAAELGSRTSWGELPCLYTIRMRRGHCLLDPAPVPPSWWAGRPLREALIRAAEAAADVFGLPGIGRRPDNYGTAVRFEGYSLPWDPRDPAQYLYPDADALAREARPGQVVAAVRILLGADRTGATYHSRHPLGQAAVRSAVFPAAGGRGQPGEIAAAVRQLTATVTGVELPGQESWAEPGR